MSAFNELLMTLDDLIDCQFLGRIKRKDVVIAHRHDDVCYAGLAENVALKPGQTIGAEDIMKEPGAGNSRVQYAHILIAWMSHQPAGKLVRPTVVGIRGRVRTGRDGLAEGHNCPSPFRRHYLHICQPEPCESWRRRRIHRHDEAPRKISCR